MNIYEKCPEFENKKFLIRLFQKEDCNDLLKVYSDKNALPFLIVIIVMEIIFIIQQKKEWKRLLAFGIWHMKMVGLSDFLLLIRQYQV